MTGNKHTLEAAEWIPTLTILVVVSDPKLLKLLHMALTLEFECEVLAVKSAGSAQEAVKRCRPALLILDVQFLNDQTADLDARRHRIAGLEQLPTLFLNATSSSRPGRQAYPTRFLEPSWKVEALYAAVRALLDQTP